MAKKVLILLGTKKGAFILESDTERRSWDLRGPHCPTWPMNHIIADPATGTIYAGGGNEWFGPAVWRSTDLGTSWTHSSRGLAYAPGAQPIKTVWSLASGHGRLYAGVEPAGLFCMVMEPSRAKRSYATAPSHCSVGWLRPRHVR